MNMDMSSNGDYVRKNQIMLELYLHFSWKLIKDGINYNKLKNCKLSTCVNVNFQSRNHFILG